MKRILYSAIFLFLLLPAIAVSGFAGEVLDAIVATVNRQPLLRSDWDEAVCFEAFMQQKPLNQVTDADRAQALQRLIDRQLLKAQMGNAESMQPTSDELKQDVAKLRAQVPNGNDDQSWRQLLASYGLDEETVKQHLRTEFQVMNFVEVRLRPHIKVQDDEVDAYYRNQVLPDLQKNGGKVVPLDELESKIRELLTQQRMDEMLDAWLHNLRQQAEIHSSISIPGVNAPADSARASGTN
jgi:SurA N-terminal domain